MSTETVVRITTEDTHKTYEFPNKDIPQLWAVGLSIQRVDAYGKAYFTGESPGACVTTIIHVEEKTLENAGLSPMVKVERGKAPEETPEDLILRLLEHVGVYPTE